MAGKDRKKELARQRYERQQARRAAQQLRARRVKVVGGVVVVVALCGVGAGIAYAVGGGGSPSKKTASDASASARPTPSVRPGECLYTASQEPGAPKDLGVPPVKPPYQAAVTATIKTDLGPIAVQLDGAHAPCTTGSFAYLASKKYFEGTSCHRLTTQGIKVLQCGDPTGSGQGGPGYRFAEENVPKAGVGGSATYARGVLAMANAGPGTNGSQFFIVYGDSPLPPNYTIFGRVTSGLQIVDDVAKAGSTPAGDGKPNKKVTIQNVTISG